MFANEAKWLIGEIIWLSGGGNTNGGGDCSHMVLLDKVRFLNWQSFHLHQLFLEHTRTWELASFSTHLACQSELGAGLAAFLRVYSHDTVGYLTRLFISAKPLLLCLPLLQQQKGKNELSFEPWHTRTHTHWRRGRGGHPVPSRSHVPPSFPPSPNVETLSRPSVRPLVRSLVSSAIVSSVLSTAPIPEAKREGEREGIGGRHRRRPRPAGNSHFQIWRRCQKSKQAIFPRQPKEEGRKG